MDESFVRSGKEGSDSGQRKIRVEVVRIESLLTVFVPQVTEGVGDHTERKSDTCTFLF